MNIMAIASIILGVALSVVPNLLFRQVVFWRGFRGAEQIVRGFYIGAALKFVAFVLLFSIVLQWSNLRADMLFGAFVLTELLRCLFSWLTLSGINSR